MIKSLNDNIKEIENLETTEGHKLKDYVQFMRIKQASTPPTQEGVCKALSEYFKQEVSYIKRELRFTQGDRKGGHLTRCNELHNTYGITGYALPPRLITLIGRFYEGLEREE